MSKQKKNETLGLKESIQLFRRAWLLLYEKMPGTLLSMMAVSAWQAIAPYIALFFSARVIGELAGDRNPTALALWVLGAILSGAAAALTSALIARWNGIEGSTAWLQLWLINGEKLMTMDFVDAESTEIRDLYHTVYMNQMGPSMGMSAVLFASSRMIQAVCQVLRGLVLTATLFFSPASAPELVWLNSPLCALGVLVLMILVGIGSSTLRNMGNRQMTDHVEDHNQANALWGFYGFLGHRTKNAPDVRIYRQELFCTPLMNDKTGSFMSKGMFAQMTRKSRGLKLAGGQALSMSFTGIAYLYVCLKALGGAFGIGMVAQYIGAFTQFSAGVALVLHELGFLPVNGKFLKINFQLLDVPNKMYMGSLTTEKRSDRKYEIEFRDVSFRYPGSEEYALRHVSLRFQVGSRMAVVGQNGSGKSTFIKLLCRLYDPEEGEILLNGIDIRKYRYNEYMNIFSVVFQDFGLLAYPLGENVAAAPRWDKDRVEDCLEKAGFGEYRQKLGLDTCLYKDFDEKGVTVSGGEAQKIAIARTLYKDAPFIILDEPTAALDPVAEEEIYTRFSQIVTDKTAIYISHRLSSCQFCDDILVFDQGQVVQQGSHQALLEKEGGKYRELWFAQAKYYEKAKEKRREAAEKQRLGTAMPN